MFRTKKNKKSKNEEIKSRLLLIIAFHSLEKFKKKKKKFFGEKKYGKIFRDLIHRFKVNRMADEVLSVTASGGSVRTRKSSWVKSLPRLSV